ncbi:MAG: photosystem I reaction center subunit VIII [Cyanobacteriota bacterium]|nr:photosystem I reaction center subunit VIII [Cyanobacteriota bacterium]
MTAAYLQPYMVLTTCWLLPAVSMVALFLWIERGSPSAD